MDPIAADAMHASDIATDDGVEVDLSRHSSAWSDDDDDSPLPPRRAKVFTPVTWTMVALLLTAGGFALGAKVGRDSAPAAAATTAGGAGGFGARAAAAGGGFGGGTFGTVKLVDGTNVYLQDSSGNVIKVTTTPEANVTVSKKGTVADLKAGDTVVVQGTADADGNIAATAIVAGGLGAGGRQRGTGGAAANNSNGQAGG